MGKLFSQYASGVQFTAGDIVGSDTGVSGINPIVDRLNKAFPDNFEYQWFDDSPNFNGNTYVADDIFLNQNMSGCRVKGSYFASGTGSMVWELYKVTTGSVVDETLLGSFASPGTSPGGLAYDSDNNNLISSDNGSDFIHTHSGISATILGSFATPATNPAGLAYDSDNSNLISADNGQNYIYKHSGISATLLGSFPSPSTGIQGLAYNSDNGNLISDDSGQNHIYIHSGISATILGSFLSTGPNPIGLAYDSSNGNLISADNGSDIIYIHSGISATILGSFASPGTNPGGLTYALAGSLISGDVDSGTIYEYDLGMESEALVSGLPYNDLFEPDTAIDIGNFPRIRLKVNRSIPQNKLHKVTFDYK